MPLSAHFDERYFASVYGNYAQQNPPRKLRFYRRLLGRHLPPAPSPRVLELGCAFGFFLAELPPAWPRFGVDASCHALSSAVRRAPGAHLVAGDCGLPPIASQFDAIAAFDVLEHIPSVDETGEFVRRSLASDGVFLFVVPVYDGPLGPVIRALDHDPTHVHKRSRRWWLEWTAQRFDVLEWTGILRYRIPPGVYLHLPGRAIRGIAPAIAVIARPRVF